ncbi:MAG: FCD domain-containing protein, partial [Acidobacteriaceae bacterium]
MDVAILTCFAARDRLLDVREVRPEVVLYLLAGHTKSAFSPVHGACSDGSCATSPPLVGGSEKCTDGERWQRRQNEHVPLREAVHRAIARASGNPVLAALMETVAGALYEARRKTVEQAGNLRESAHAHREIYRAIRSRDRARARELMIRHLRRAEAAEFEESGTRESDGNSLAAAASLSGGAETISSGESKAERPKTRGLTPRSQEESLRTIRTSWLALAIPVVFGIAAVAQDTRRVTEPTIPPACATLKAALAAPHGVLS